MSTLSDERIETRLEMFAARIVQATNSLEQLAERITETELPAQQYAQPLVEEVAGHTGYQDILRADNPAANTSYRYRVPGDWVMYPLSVICTLATSGTSGERSISVEYQDGTDSRYIVAGANVTLSASQTQSFCWWHAAGDVYWPVNDCAVAPLPRMYLYPAYSLVIKLAGGHDTDQLSGIIINRWLYPTGTPVKPPPLT